ncbi:hypothetical protein Tco_1282364 [Tanacetum coccineum]
MHSSLVHDTPSETLRAFLFHGSRNSSVDSGLLMKSIVNPTTNCRKAHLLGDKQIPSVGVFNESLGRHLMETRDLGSILEETGQEYNFTPKEGLKNNSQLVETALGKLATSSRSASDRIWKSYDGVWT